MLPQLLIAIVWAIASHRTDATLPEIVQTAVSGILVGPVSPVETEPPVCSKFGFECTSDCKTFMVCSQIGQPADSLSRCASDRPYCTNNACSAQPDNTNEQCFSGADPSGQFVCTAAGFFPDPHNCGLYYSCAGPAPAVAVQYRCPVGSAYDSRRQSCMTTTARTAAKSRALQAKMCSTCMCAPKFVGYVAYPPNPQLYVFCFEETRMVFRCRDDQNQVFDAKRGECVFECQAEGHFADREDCQRFYTCTKRLGKLTATRNTCPPRFWWSGVRCESEGATQCVPQLT